MTALRVTQAAHYLGLSVNTLNKWRVQGRGPNFVKLGRAVCYKQSELDAWLDRQVHSSTSSYDSS